MSNINETLLDDLLGKLESVRSWSPRVVSKLETLIRTGDDYTLFRINPIQFATEKGIAEPEAIDLFLHSTKLGLFEMDGITLKFVPIRDDTDFKGFPIHQPGFVVKDVEAVVALQ